MKTVLITGANKGIGLQTARQLAQAGYRVFIGSRNEAKGKEAATQLREAGLTTVEAVVLDVTDLSSISKARAVIESKVDALDVLVNNAGITGSLPQAFSSGSIDNLRRVYDTNFFGAVQTTQAFLPLLKKADAPVIINVSSEVGSLAMHSSAGRNPNWDNFPAYGSSKTALNAFTVMLANELKEAGFIVNSVTPGYTATDLNQNQGTKTAAEGASVIAAAVMNAHGSKTGNYIRAEGEVPW